jgi:hypothetical protein
LERSGWSKSDPYADLPGTAISNPYLQTIVKGPSHFLDFCVVYRIGVCCPELKLLCVHAAQRRGSSAADRREGTKERSDLAVTCSRLFGHALIWLGSVLHFLAVDEYESKHSKDNCSLALESCALVIV